MSGRRAPEMRVQLSVDQIIPSAVVFDLVNTFANLELISVRMNVRKGVS